MPAKGFLSQEQQKKLQKNIEKIKTDTKIWIQLGKQNGAKIIKNRC